MNSTTLDTAHDLIIRAGLATGTPHSRIYSNKRSKRLVRIRWAIMHTLRTRHGWTFAEIGAHFCCDHSNVIHGVNRATSLIKEDHWFSALTKNLANP